MAIDTNVLVRVLVAEPAEQSRAAGSTMAGARSVPPYDGRRPGFAGGSREASTFVAACSRGGLPRPALARDPPLTTGGATPSLHHLPPPAERREPAGDRSSRATDRWGARPSPASSVVQGDRSVGGSPEPGELGRPGRPIGGGLARARRDRSSRATGAIVNGSRSAAGHTGLAHPEAVHARLHPHPGPRRGRRDEVDLVRRDLWSKGVASRAWHPSAPFGSHASVVHVRGTCTSELAGSSE